jgi:thiosulfate/3-mercaptopyruvate sulfurtransferase
MGRFMISIRSWFAGVGVIALLALIIVNAASAGEAYCDACKGDSGWSGASKLDEIGNPNAGKAEVMPGLSTAQKNRVGIWKQPLAGFDGNNAAVENNSVNNNNVTKKEPTKKAAKSIPVPENASIVRSLNAKGMLLPVEDVSDNYVLLDISENASEYIQGATAISYNSFLNSTTVKSELELARILGDAGISRDDPVVIYGECMPCGGGPAPATFVYWIMKSLGQEDLRVMDGTVKDWAAAGKPIADKSTKIPPKTYNSQIRPEFTATYDYVKSGSAQIVDARTMQEFGSGSIPGSINIPYESIISNNRIKDETKLEKVFAILDKNQPVVVYTNTGIMGSVVWFALELLGYDAKLYSYEDYLINQAASNPLANGNATT